MTSPKAIIFSKNQIDALVKHAGENLPNESCAILFGNAENDQVIVKGIFFTKNIDESPVKFTISNDDLISAYSEAERKKQDVCAIFHSHPSSLPYPSSTDKKYMEINPVPWVIFSDVDQQFKAYVYNSDIIQVPVKIL